MNRDLSIDPGRAMLWATPISFILLALGIVPHQLMHGENALKSLFQFLGGWWIAPALFAGIVAHELLHGAVWAMTGEISWRRIEFGMNWRVLMPYSHPAQPIPAWSYAWGGAAPGIVLGAVPAAIGLATANGAWSGWGALFMAAACGDILVLHSLRGVPGDALVRDHPSRVGCEVVSSSEAA